jgi:hypothetical protein
VVATAPTAEEMIQVLERHKAKNPLFVVDVDGVLFQQDAADRPHLLLATLKRMSCSDRVLDLFYDAPKRPVNKRLNLYIAEHLIAEGYLVIAVTACSMQRASQREMDLRSCGVDLSLLWGDMTISFDWGLFKNGVLYCGAKDKGPALLALINELRVMLNRLPAGHAVWMPPLIARIPCFMAGICIPGKCTVIAVDDNKGNVESIIQTCATRGINCLGMHYTEQEEWYRLYPQLRVLAQIQVLALKLGCFLDCQQALELMGVLTPLPFRCLCTA